MLMACSVGGEIDKNEGMKNDHILAFCRNDRAGIFNQGYEGQFYCSRVLKHLLLKGQVWDFLKDMQITPW